MPSIQDMGIAPYLQPQQTLANDPTLLLQALALRERNRQARVDEGMRERQFDQSKKEFERSAGQRDQQIGMGREELGLRKQSFKVGMEDRQRAMGQEAAASGMFADLAEQMGVFATDNGQPIPGARERFGALAPDDQQRAIGMFQAEQVQKQQAAQFKKLGTMLENAAANQLMDPAEAQAILGMGETDPEAAYKEAQNRISETVKRNTDMQQRQQGVEALGQTLQGLGLKPERMAAYISELQVDPDATYRDVLKRALAEDEQMEADLEEARQRRAQQEVNKQNLMMLNSPGATPEQKAESIASLRAAGIPVDPNKFGGPNEPIIGEPDKMTLEAAKKRYEESTKFEDVPIGEKRRALRDYAEQFRAATGKELPGARDLDPDEKELDSAISKAKKKLGKGASEDDILAEAERIIYGEK